MGKQGIAATEAASIRKRIPGLDLKGAYVKRNEILGQGMTVSQFLNTPLVGVQGTSDVLGIIKAAGDLLKIAGSREKAEKALSMFDELSK